jgi:acyl-CoA dehydrogenase
MSSKDFSLFMSPFEPGQQVRLTKKSLSEFIEHEVKPLEEDHRDLLVPDYRRLQPDGRLKDEALAVIESVREKSGSAGYYGMHMPESVGGSGFDILQLAHLLIHIYSHGFSLNFYINENVQGPHRNFMVLPDDLKREYLEPAVDGEKGACFALTEGSSGSDAMNMDTTAEKDGGEWVINGTKMWITNAPYADFGQVFAMTDPDAEKKSRTSAFFFDPDESGCEVSPINQTLMNDGMQAEIEFDEYRVPHRYLMGERGGGFEIATYGLNEGRVRIAARCCGLMRYLIDQVREYAKDRTSWGKPIGERQHVRGMIADMATWQATAENHVLRTAYRITQGEDPLKQSAMAKYYATEKFFEAADNAVQIFGANGLSHDYPIQRIFRYARLLRIVEGTSEIQKETIASEIIR